MADSYAASLAVEFAARNIAVNCVSAGPVYGEVLGKFPDAAEKVPYWEKITPTQRLTSCEDISPIIAFLLSKASSAVIGATWVVDGGVSLTGDCILPNSGVPTINPVGVSSLLNGFDEVVDTQA